MGCIATILNGIGRACKANLAGIETLYIADFDKIDTEYNAETMKITKFENKSGDAKEFYTYLLDEEVGSLTSTLTKAAGGIHYYTNEIGVQFSKMSAEKHLELQAISHGYVICVVKDNNGLYWVCGADKYLSGEDTVAQAGQAFDDLNGYTSVIRGRSGFMPFLLEGELLTNFLTNMVNDAPEEIE